MTTSSKPLVELFVKASSTSKGEKGPCLIGQQWFMVLYSLVERGLIDLRFTPMTHDFPPPAYTRLNAARHLPVAWIESGTLNGQDVSGTVIPSFESLELLMDRLEYPNLNPLVSLTEVHQAEHVFEDLISHLMHFIRYDNPKSLLGTLTKINEYLSHRKGPFLLDSEISYPDCQLMPKLQHVRVTCRAYKNFDIPEHLTHLWNYIRNMYRVKAFVCSCPSDRDILIHYSEKDALPKNVRLSLLGSDFLSDVPNPSQKISPVMINGTTAH